ncbi:hypothetical protein [Escherichia coli]|uniref:hypothetical protein n=1 Tax=Escherichia coli TaxID=562 RepID=UPI00388D20DB
MGKLSRISKIYGELISWCLSGYICSKDALFSCENKGSSYLADDIIIHRKDNNYLKQRINDENKISISHRSNE